VEAAFAASANRRDLPSRAARSGRAHHHADARKEYAQRPQPVLISRFGEAEAAAVESLKTLQGLVEELREAKPGGPRRTGGEPEKDLPALTAEQDNLGLTSSQAFRGSLRDNGTRSSRSSTSTSPDCRMRTIAS